MPQLQFTPHAYAQRLPEVFSLLEQLRVDDAIVYGGCLRDGHFGKPVRDYDLIVPCDRPFRNAGSLHCRISSASVSVLSLHPEEMKFAYTLRNGLMLDIHYAQEGDEVVRPTAAWKAGKSSIGLSGIALDQRTGRVWVDRDFLIDEEDRTLTYRPSILNVETSSYVEKIHHKYPDYTPRYKNVIDTGW